MEKQNLSKKKGVGFRMWLVYILVGLAGQFAWAIENMYLNTYLAYLAFTSTAEDTFNYSLMIAITTAASAVVATLTTLFMGGFTDKKGHRKIIISFGYILWGLATAAFGLCNVTSPKEIIPIAMSVSAAAITVIILDCVMTFFGSSANDASFNSLVTSSTSDDNRGRVEGVLSILPLIAMLAIFVGLNNLTTEAAGYQWDLFFYIIGGIVTLVGIISFFLIPKEEKQDAKKEPYWSLLLEGFRKETIKNNKALYLTLVVYFIYSVAVQVYFPYLMIYIEKTCQISNTGTEFLSPFATVMAIALLGGSVLSVLLGWLADKIGKKKMIIPSFAILLIGLILLFFVPGIENENERTIYCAVAGLVMILGYVGVPTIINALVRQYIPKGKEGVFMGVRMIFVVALPMCIGPFIGDGLNRGLGISYTTEFKVLTYIPTKYSYLVAGAILLLALIPIYFLFRLGRRPGKNQGHLYAHKEKIKIDPNYIPLAEYPRPNFVRDSYLCLNGVWNLKITKSKEMPTSFNKKIVVPYAVESPLSGVEYLLEPDEYLWYQREVKIPRGFNKGRLVLNFDGIDQIADVFVNGKLIAHHVGGYTKFSAEILDKIKNSTFILTIRVQDVTDESYYERGKQVLKPEKWFYTSSSGIYKTVWLESTPKDYISELKIDENFNAKKIFVTVKSPSKGQAVVTVEGIPHKINTNEVSEIPLMDFKTWSPESPFLYQIKAVLGKDEVSSYFGMRKIEVKKENGKPALFLNGKKLILTGLLDQGYYYLGNLTPKTYVDFEKDIINTKLLGYNVLRVHIKIESEIFYYYADKYGLLLIQDFPNGGTHYSFFNVAFPAKLHFMNRPSRITYKRLSRTDKEGRDMFIKEGKEWLSQLHNFPSIIIFTIFNEGWGEFDPEDIFFTFRKEDAFHLFDTASGWYDVHTSDIYSVHDYDLHFPLKKDRTLQRPNLLSETGGTSYVVPDHFFFEGLYGLHYVKSKEELTSAYVRLYEKKLLPLIKNGDLVGIIYTELNDCESEANGLYPFDRSELKIDPLQIKRINSLITAPSNEKKN
jgi:MFS family permease